MASMWDKLKKIASGVKKGFSHDPSIRAKAEDKRKKKELKGETVIGRQKGKVAKHSDVYMKAKAVKSKTIHPLDKDKPIEKLKPHQVRTEYTPAQEVTKGGTYQKYGKKTKSAEDFRGAFAKARKAYEGGSGGKVFEHGGKKFSVARADDPKGGISKVSDVQPPAGLDKAGRDAWLKKQNEKELERASGEAGGKAGTKYGEAGARAMENRKIMEERNKKLKKEKLAKILPYMKGM